MSEREVWQVIVRSTLPEDFRQTSATGRSSWFGEMEFEAEGKEEATARAVAAEQKLFPRNPVEVVWARRKAKEVAKLSRREAAKREQAKREKRKRQTARRRIRRGHPRNGGAA